MRRIERIAKKERRNDNASSHLTEMLLIQVVRMVLAGHHAPSPPGWVAGLSSPQIGAALAAIHGEPEHPWSVDSLAAHTGEDSWWRDRSLRSRPNVS